MVEREKYKKLKYKPIYFFFPRDLICFFFCIFFQFKNEYSYFAETKNSEMFLKFLLTFKTLYSRICKTWKHFPFA